MPGGVSSLFCFCFDIEDNYLCGYGAVQASGLHLYLRERLWALSAGFGGGEEGGGSPSQQHWDRHWPWWWPPPLFILNSPRLSTHLRSSSSPRVARGGSVSLCPPPTWGLSQPLCGAGAWPRQLHRKNVPALGSAVVFGFWLFSPILLEDLQWTEQLQSPAV